MKTFSTLLIALFVACVGQAQPSPLPPRSPGFPPPGGPFAPTVAAKDPVNYLIHVEWNDVKGDPKSLDVLTTEGGVQYDGLQKNSVKINNNDVPVTLKLSGTLTALNDEKGRLQLFLGRTVPYVTGTMGSGPGAMSSYSQMSVGLQSTFVVKFGKPEVIQNDENGTITVLVKRMAD